MLRAVGVGLLALWIGMSTARALTPGEAVMQATRAFQAADAAAIQSLIAATSAWQASRSRDELYAAAFLQFRRAQLAVAAEDDNVLRAAGNLCVAKAGVAAALDAKFADGLALQSACYGYLANLGGFAAIGNGRRSGKAMDAALALEPNNPRVILIDAISYAFRPRIAGGDKVKAYARAKQAAAAFDANKLAVDDITNWGMPEAWYWVARGAQDAGDTAAARQAYERALAAAPQFAAARRRLDSLR